MKASHPVQCWVLVTKLTILLTLILQTFLLVSCRRSDSPRTSGVDYQLKGEIVAILADRKTFIIKHEEIPGFMPAMTMEFKVGAAEVAAFKPGQFITARLVQTGDGGYHLESVFPYDRSQAELVEAEAAKLRQETLIRGRSTYREMGETVPDFALYNQEGKAVQASGFRGKRVVLNFIYTRCPIATMCPASTSNMISLQRLARENGIGDLEFVSISLDPSYDTPAVLKEYAATRGIDTANFSLLTGPESAVRDLLVNFGVIAERQESIIKHTLSTLLIDQRGVIVYRVDGSQWDPAQFIKRIPPN